MKINNLQKQPGLLPLVDNTARQQKATQPSKSQNDKLREVCQQFEAFFIAELLKTAEQSGQLEGMLKESRAEKIFTVQRHTAISQVLAKRNTLGIGRLFYDELKEHLKTVESAKSAENS